MMHDIDAMLDALRDEALPSRLSAIDGAVFDGLTARRERQFSRHGMVLAIVVAGFLGLSVGIGSGSPASAERLLGTPTFAPSHLLADG